MSPGIECHLLPELEQLLNRFFFCLDRFDYAALLALTRDDFCWHRQGQILEGHAAVRSALDTRPATQRVAHIISNTFIERAETDSAVTHSYMTAYRFDDGQGHAGPVSIRGPLRINRVTTRFDRDAQTGWQIAEQKLVPEFEFDAPRS